MGKGGASRLCFLMGVLQRFGVVLKWVWCWMGRCLCVGYCLYSWCFGFSLSIIQRVSCSRHGSLTAINGTFIYLQACLLGRILCFGCVDKIHCILWRV